jgi:hypothetical protein
MIAVFGCSPLFFLEPMPPNAEETKIFPIEFEGKYLKTNERRKPIKGNFGGYIFYDIVRVSNQHIIIYEYEETSLDEVVNESNKNEYQILDNTLIIKKEGSIKSIENLQFLEDDIIRFPKIKLYELGLKNQSIKYYGFSSNY